MRQEALEARFTKAEKAINAAMRKLVGAVAVIENWTLVDTAEAMGCTLSMFTIEGPQRGKSPRRHILAFDMSGRHQIEEFLADRLGVESATRRMYVGPKRGLGPR